MILDRLNIVMSAAALSLATAVSGGWTDPALAQDGGSLVLYTSTPTDQVDFYVKAFEEKTGIKTEIITGGTGDLLNRVKAEAGRPQGDILWGGSSTTGGSEPDLFVPYTPPEASQIDPAFLDPAGYNAPFDAFTMVIVYNKNLVSAEDAPKTWADLADPKWKGKVRYANPASSSSSYAALVNWKLIGGWEFVEKLVPNFIIDQSSSAPFTAVGQGEAELGVAYEEGAYRYLDSGNVGIVYPADGVVLLPGGLFVIKDGPNPDAAKQFADFMLAVEQEQALVDFFPGRRPSSDLVNLPDVMPPASALNVLEYPTKEAKEKQGEWLAKWQDIMIDAY